MDGSKFDDVTRRFGRVVSRRAVAKGVVGSLAGLLVGGARRDASAARILTICHATGDTYEAIEVSQREFGLHARHGDFVRVECCVDDDCASLDGMCSDGTCQNGYCVQLPKPAGTACGSDNACFEQATCDGAMNCTGTDIPIVCDPIDQCHTTSCDPATGCVQTPNEGASCIPDDTHDGTCDADGICQPILICAAAPTCQSSDDCPDGATCINGGCFATCETRCERDCAHCLCVYTRNPSVRYCLDADTYIGTCQSDANCPSGTLCSGFMINTDYLCTQPCAYKQ